jgi:hypothetical protein
LPERRNERGDFLRTKPGAAIAAKLTDESEWGVAAYRRGAALLQSGFFNSGPAIDLGFGDALSGR